MDPAGGNGAPLGVALFLAQMTSNASIGQRVPYPLAANTLTVTLGLESDLSSGGARITLSGLGGATSPSGGRILT
jgi:hypothetical protein